MVRMPHSDTLKLLEKLNVTSMACLSSQQERPCTQLCSVDPLLNLSFHAISHDSKIDAGFLWFSSIYNLSNNIHMTRLPKKKLESHTEFTLFPKIPISEYSSSQSYIHLYSKYLSSVYHTPNTLLAF